MAMEDVERVQGLRAPSISKETLKQTPRHSSVQFDALRKFSTKILTNSELRSSYNNADIICFSNLLTHFVVVLLSFICLQQSLLHERVLDPWTFVGKCTYSKIHFILTVGVNTLCVMAFSGNFREAFKKKMAKARINY